jgi:hypothetical protein
MGMRERRLRRPRMSKSVNINAFDTASLQLFPLA